MESQLTTLLLTNNKLPLFIRVIGFLRKLNSQSDVNLQTLFISQRNKFMLSLLSSLDKKDPFEYLKLYIETVREHLFDIITQFKSIFPSINYTPGIDLKDTSTLLTSFTWNLINVLTNEFTTHLASLTKFAQISTLYTQVMYLGVSLSRVGLDVRFSLSHLFSSRVGNLINTRLNSVTEILVNQIRNSTQFELIKETHFLDKEDDASMNTFTKSKIISPNTKLSRYLLFNTYYNSIFQLLNECRLIVFQNEKENIKMSLNTEFDKVEKELALPGNNDNFLEVKEWFSLVFRLGLIMNFDLGFQE